MSERPLRILYVGSTMPQSTSAMRLRAMRSLGHEVRAINSSVMGQWPLAKLLTKVQYRLRRPRDAGVNRQVLTEAANYRPNIVWIDKGNIVRPRTLQALREQPSRPIIAGYSPDLMSAAHNSSVYFQRGLRHYDVFFSTKSYDLDHLRACGVPQAVFTENAFDPETHRPIGLSEEDRAEYGAEVGFIGTYEQARATSLAKISSAGIEVQVRGNGWQRCSEAAQLDVRGSEVYGDDYAKALSAPTISTCFLRKLNFDRQTQRSVEIPACGGFMLAERTDEHLALFEEGVEAEFFGSDEELLDKARYYLKHRDARDRIAAAGRERCLRSGYSYTERLRPLVELCVKLAEEGLGGQV